MKEGLRGGEGGGNVVKMAGGGEERWIRTGMDQDRIRIRIGVERVSWWG